MILPEYIKNYLTDPDNIYDLIGNCFGLLCDNISNHQLFISRYFGEETEAPSNPNLGLLDHFSEKVMELAVDYKPSKYQEFIAEILKLVYYMPLVNYLDSKENNLTIVYALISGIDAAARNWDSQKFHGKLGPLDRLNKTGYRVYFNVKNTLHVEYIDNVGRDRVRSSDFFEQFESFRFLRERHWKENISSPELILSTPLRTQQQNTRKLRIAVIPASNKPNYRFNKTEGSGIKVEYTQMSQDEVTDNIIISFKKALKAGSNIIVLPEYVLSPEVYEKVRGILREEMFNVNTNQGPDLVFAGTTWTDDDNNVLKILDKWGDEIGEYYKYSPFTLRQKGTHRFVQCEALSTPGKVCDLVAIDGIGVILPAICRDVIDGEYTEELARIFLPLLIVISACSKSVASFMQRQSEFANKYFMSSILANACCAVRKSTARIGAAAIVHKENTIAGALIKEICRDNCVTDCKKSGCVYIVQFDFSYVDQKKNTQLCIKSVI